VYAVRGVRVRASQPHTIRRTRNSRTRCGGQERRSRLAGSEAVGVFRDQQLRLKPRRHQATPPNGARLTRIPFVSVAWILRADGTGSLCRASHMCCDKVSRDSEKCAFRAPKIGTDRCFSNVRLIGEDLPLVESANTITNRGRLAADCIDHLVANKINAFRERLLMAKAHESKRAGSGGKESTGREGEAPTWGLCRRLVRLRFLRHRFHLYFVPNLDAMGLSQQQHADDEGKARHCHGVIQTGVDIARCGDAGNTDQGH